MTLEEAIEIIEKQIVTCEAMIEFNENFDPEYDNTKFLKEKEALLMAVKSIKEVQQYRKIGTAEECREAVGKQKPKKRIYPKTALERYYHAPECPNCKRELKPRICGYTLSQAIGTYLYCPWCGQKMIVIQNGANMNF